MLSYT
ncbi:hypothetical protein VTH06DRAFT_2832 [Thermothelomyces fergusii]